VPWLRFPSSSYLEPPPLYPPLFFNLERFVLLARRLPISSFRVRGRSRLDQGFPFHPFFFFVSQPCKTFSASQFLLQSSASRPPPSFLFLPVTLQLLHRSFSVLPAGNSFFPLLPPFRILEFPQGGPFRKRTSECRPSFSLFSSLSTIPVSGSPPPPCVSPLLCRSDISRAFVSPLPSRPQPLFSTPLNPYRPPDVTIPAILNGAFPVAGLFLSSLPLAPDSVSTFFFFGIFSRHNS